MPPNDNKLQRDYFVDGFNKFLEIAGKYQVLTLQEEIELNQRRLAGDAAAEERLILSNLRLVVSRVAKFASNPSEIPDLAKEGYFGLQKAVKGFDETRGYRFSTYAVHWINKFLKKYDSTFIEIPLNLKNRISRIEELEDVFYNEWGRNPSKEKLIELYQNRYGQVISTVQIARARNVRPLYNTPSLDYLRSNPDKDKAPYQFVQTVFEAPNTIAEKRDLSERLDEVLSKLTERDEMVIRLRYGINPERYGEKEELSLESIVHVLARYGYLNQRDKNLTKEGIRLIEKGAMKKLRGIIENNPEYGECFRDYLYGEYKPEDLAVEHIPLEQALEKLKPIERRVLSLRYSSNGNPPLYSEISFILGQEGYKPKRAGKQYDSHFLSNIRRKAVTKLRDLTGINSIEDVLRSVQFLNSL